MRLHAVAKLIARRFQRDAGAGDAEIWTQLGHGKLAGALPERAGRFGEGCSRALGLCRGSGVGRPIADVTVALQGGRYP